MYEISKKVWGECKVTSERISRTLTQGDLLVDRPELALEKQLDQH